MFKRFRDAATGLFTSKADAAKRPAHTVGEQVSVDAIELAVVRAKLARAMAKTKAPHMICEQRCAILFDAIEEVLDERGRV